LKTRLNLTRTLNLLCWSQPAKNLKPSLKAESLLLHPAHRPVGLPGCAVRRLDLRRIPMALDLQSRTIPPNRPRWSTPSKWPSLLRAGSVASDDPQPDTADKHVHSVLVPLYAPAVPVYAHTGNWCRAVFLLCECRFARRAF